MTSQHGTRYLRFAALGDSTTVGIGDPVPGGAWRGWARLLADALASSYDVSFCNLAISGATSAVVRHEQAGDAEAHRPDLASLVVGVNDTMRSTWDPVRIREDLLLVAGRLDAVGATLMTVRFHDHSRVVGLPQFLARPMAQRIAHVNAVYDEIHETYGGVRVDLAGRPELGRRDCWSVDRFHPSETGHRLLARVFGERLRELGYDFTLPGLQPAGGLPPSWKRDLGWMVVEGAPWCGRRARDLGPWIGRRAWDEVRRVAPRHRLRVPVA